MHNKRYYSKRLIDRRNKRLFKLQKYEKYTNYSSEDSECDIDQYNQYMNSTDANISSLICDRIKK